MPLVSLDRITMAYGHVPLLDQASLQIDAAERVCVIGRNGTGKSTLLQIISGDVHPDAGSVRREPGLRVARLVQDLPGILPSRQRRSQRPPRWWSPVSKPSGPPRFARSSRS